MHPPVIECFLHLCAVFPVLSLPNMDPCPLRTPLSIVVVPVPCRIAVVRVPHPTLFVQKYVTMASRNPRNGNYEDSAKKLIMQKFPSLLPNEQKFYVLMFNAYNPSAGVRKNENTECHT